MKKLQSLSKKSQRLIIIVALFAIIGVSLLVFSKAATGTASFSITPATGSYPINTNFTVSVYANPNGSTLAGVDMFLAYDATKLDFISVDITGAAFTDCPGGYSGANGLVSVRCVKYGTPNTFTTSIKVANVTFRTKVGTGTTALSFAANSALYDTNVANVWNGVTTGSTYTLTTPDTTPPSVSITSPTNGATVSGNSVTVNATATDDSGVISKVEFYVNNVLKATDNSSPYSYVFDSSSVVDGAYPVKVIAYDGATPTPNQGTSTINVTVQNNKPNLTVSSINIVPASPKIGDTVTFSAVLTNNGTAATGTTAFVTGFSVDSTVLTGPTTSTSIPVGGTATVTATWVATAGAHVVTVSTDKNNALTEVSETDNTSTKNFTAYKGGDANNDNAIDTKDAVILSLNWGKTSGVSFSTGDFNSDGVIDTKDAVILSLNWGK